MPSLMLVPYSSSSLILFKKNKNKSCCANVCDVEKGANPSFDDRDDVGGGISMLI